MPRRVQRWKASLQFAHKTAGVQNLARIELRLETGHDPKRSLVYRPPDIKLFQHSSGRSLNDTAPSFGNQPLSERRDERRRPLLYRAGPSELHVQDAVPSLSNRCDPQSPTGSEKFNLSQNAQKF